jgi:hypothetical protein
MPLVNDCCFEILIVIIYDLMLVTSSHTFDLDFIPDSSYCSLVDFYFRSKIEYFSNDSNYFHCKFILVICMLKDQIIEDLFQIIDQYFEYVFHVHKSSL